MVFYWILSDNKSPLVSKTLVSILAVFNNVVVWMVSTRLLISKSSCPFNNPLVTVPSALITFGIIVAFKFHSFFSSLARSRYLFLFSLSFSFTLQSAGTAKSIIRQVLWRYPCCNGYRRRNWTRWHEFKSWTDCISHSTNTLGKGMNPIILPPAKGK